MSRPALRRPEIGETMIAEENPDGSINAARITAE